MPTAESTEYTWQSIHAYFKKRNFLSTQTAYSIMRTQNVCNNEDSFEFIEINLNTFCIERQLLNIQ